MNVKLVLRKQLIVGCKTLLVLRLTSSKSYLCLLAVLIVKEPQEIGNLKSVAPYDF